jgi:hypothetical protein
MDIVKDLFFSLREILYVLHFPTLPPIMNSGDRRNYRSF